MKTRTILFLQSLVIILLLVYILFYCGDASSTSEVDDVAVITQVENSRHAINEQQVRTLYENYKGRFIPKIKDFQEEVKADDGTILLAREDYLPTEYSLVPLDKLKNYIAFLDVLQKKNPDQPISGIAISFGAYDIDKEVKNDTREGAKQKDPLRNGDYRGRLTTYFTPTYYDDSIKSEYDASNHIPFYIDYEDEGDKLTGTYKSLFCYLDPKSCDLNATVDPTSQNATLSPLASLFTSTSIQNNVEIVSFNEFTDMPPKKPKGNQ